MENEHNSGAFKGFVVVVLLLLAICASICTYKYVKKEIPNITQTSTEEFETEQAPTVEEAMNEWLTLKEYNRCYDVYYNLPPEIVKALFEKLGTMEIVKNYVYEYEKNREYYISIQIAEQLKKNGLDNPGVDGKRIKEVEISTKLQEDTKTEKLVIPAKAADETKDTVSIH